MLNPLRILARDALRAVGVTVRSDRNPCHGRTIWSLVAGPLEVSLAHDAKGAELFACALGRSVLLAGTPEALRIEHAGPGRQGSALLLTEGPPVWREGSHVQASYGPLRAWRLGSLVLSYHGGACADERGA
jgi:hypothetical protein